MPDETLDTKKRAEAACLSSLPWGGRALVEPGLYPKTVMDCTVQAYEKERRKAFEQDAGGCCKCPLAQTPLGIDPKSLTKIPS